MLGIVYRNEDFAIHVVRVKGERPKKPSDARRGVRTRPGAATM
jgi:hypothetical protein